MTSKIMSLTFIDHYNNVKDILPNNTSISSQIPKTEIANAVIGYYKELAKKLYLCGH